MPPYNKLLNENNRFIDKLKEYSINYNDNNVVPVSLTPRIFSEERFSTLKNQCEKVLEAIEIILKLYAKNEVLRQRFSEFSSCRELTLKTPPYKNWIHYARFDIAETPEGDFKMMETNSDSPGGVLFTPIIHQIHNQLPLTKECLNSLNLVVQPIEDKTVFIRSLISKYKEVTGNTKKKPNIAFVNSTYRPIYTEMELFPKIANEYGVNSTYKAIQNINHIDGHASWDNHKIDVVYQKFDNLTTDDGESTLCMFISEDEKNNSCYQKSLENNDFIYLNSFPSSTVGESKRIMTVLVDPIYQSYFSIEQQEAIKALCPNTFCLDGQHYEKKTIEAINNKDKYVLKKCFDTRGRSVIIGKFTSQAVWEKAIQNAINKAWVIQEYIPQYLYQIYSSDKDLKPIKVSGVIGVYLINGKSVGASCRASSDAVINMARSGFHQPIYIIEGQYNIDKTRKIETEFYS